MVYVAAMVMKPRAVLGKALELAGRKIVGIIYRRERVQHLCESFRPPDRNIAPELAILAQAIRP
jgi:hypothetical protein